MNTKVILVTDVKNLGEEGDIKEVARGYARNFLLPKKFVVPYNKGNLAMIVGRRAIIEKKKEDKRKAAQSLKEQIEGTAIKIIMPMGDNGKLFGSVTNATISDELGKAGISVERKRIEVPGATIKNQGNYTVKVRLYENEEASLKIVVNPKEAKPADSAEKAPAEKADATEAAAPEAETAPAAGN